MVFSSFHGTEKLQFSLPHHQSCRYCKKHYFIGTFLWKTEMLEPKFFTESWQEWCGWNRVCQTLILVLWLVNPFVFPDKNSPNIANRIFPGKGRGDKALILTNLDSQRLRFFHTSVYFMSLRFTLKRFKIFNLTTTSAILMNLPRLCIFMRVEIEKLLEPEVQFFGLIFRNF